MLNNYTNTDNKTEKVKMKKLNVTLFTSSVGNTSIEVPEHMTLEEAIQYAKENISKIPTPKDLEYVCDSDVIDEDNCDFDIN